MQVKLHGVGDCGLRPGIDQAVDCLPVPLEDEPEPRPRYAGNQQRLFGINGRFALVAFRDRRFADAAGGDMGRNQRPRAVRIDFHRFPAHLHPCRRGGRLRRLALLNKCAQDQAKQRCAEKDSQPLREKARGPAGRRKKGSHYAFILPQARAGCSRRFMSRLFAPRIICAT